jgi:uncharacterized protein with gpF-like domain
MTALRKLTHKEFHNFRRGRIRTRTEIRRNIALRKNLERLIYGRLYKAFRKIINSRAYLYGEFMTFEMSSTVRDLNEEMLPVLEEFYRTVFQRVYASNTETYDMGTKQDDLEAVVFGRNTNIEREVRRFFRERQLILAGISVRIANKIDQIIKKGRADNLTLQQIARNIAKFAMPFARSRAAMIARTETHNAAGYASHRYHETVKENLDIDMVKRWVSVADGRTRSHHRTANGQTRKMEEDFEIGGLPMSHVGDPRGGAKNTINCRCVIVYADQQDIVVN